MLAFSDKELAILTDKIIDRADLIIVLESAAKRFGFDWDEFYKFANWAYDIKEEKIIKRKNYEAH